MALLRYFLKPLLAGLVLALLIVVVNPKLRSHLPRLDSSISQVERSSYATAVRRAAPAVVNIYTARQGANNFAQITPQGLGSGIIMSADGIVLTNYHVVRQAEQIFVALQDGRISEAQLVGSDPYTDLAVLNIDLPQLPVIPIDMNRHVRVGDVVLAIGNPFNLGQTITQGIISANGRNGLSSDFQDFIQTDAAINQGNSGGALVDADGRLVGINTANYQQLGGAGVGLNFAIPIELAYNIMEKLISDGRVIRGHLGFGGDLLSQAESQRLRLLEGRAVIINAVDPNGPVGKAGLRVGDILIALNGMPITGLPMLQDAIAETPPGTEVNLTLIRQGKRYSVPVNVAERPPLT